MNERPFDKQKPLDITKNKPEEKKKRNRNEEDRRDSKNNRQQDSRQSNSSSNPSMNIGGAVGGVRQMGR